ncbi:hypothetical protein JIG36_05725 [Actinoplanes sp. LDG1-06]|uniref:Trypsin-co-occurring domain-containing protein n=1 Tax=Paractinoplanes ovalisporus TaxID=2810368 RepID=A0ABS2A5D6_9ACTN|nr:trypco2 family protein [Actinoplanes ovalisporus]MBM2615058.1 hypothetical protein [Actinoplanes ovalisporus]
MDIELGDAVAALRSELLLAAENGIDQDVSFVVGPIELEFAVELRADARAKAGFKAWVVTGEVAAGVNRGTTQKVKVTLTPQRPDGGGWLVAGRPPASGPAQHSDRLGR